MVRTGYSRGVTRITVLVIRTAQREMEQLTVKSFCRTNEHVRGPRFKIAGNKTSQSVQAGRERKHRGSKRKKKKGEDRRMDGERKKERKREEGAHFLTFFMLHASRDHGSGRERKKEREGGGRPAKAPPHHHPTNSSMRPQSAEQGCRRCR